MKQQNLQDKLKLYRLSQAEYEMVCKLLGHEPQGVEWALFSALWSEHCSYKSSRVHLKGLFNKSPRVLQSFGENAGVVDLGEGERVAFKIESHNHPSYIEPYQGAATGVGGILRDIFTMGARPVALADYLCFGEPSAARMTTLVDGVVRGIGGYGNCVGVPTITGQTEFHESYNGNILVNAMAVGLFRPGEQVFLSKAKGPGNWIVYVGAKTGRDGVHGASMASESFSEDSAAKRPTVQIGDPFFEKLLIESCLEVMAQDLVVAIQDMGAAGLTSSSFEMASKGGVGLTMDLDKVPLRDPTMQPEEILLSESQERMLLVCEPKKFEKLAEVFHRWGLDACVIGEVKAEKTVMLKWHGEVLTEIDPDLLVENAPAYKRPYRDWTPTNWQPKGQGSAAHDLTGGAELKTSLASMLSDVRGGSREWIYRQYDQRVGASTIADCRDSVGVVRLADSKRALGVVLGCRPHVMRFDAKIGGADAIAYPALELAAKGFEALAVTDCLNFGNPEKEQTMTEFVAALQGMNSICELIETPIISGNVSFYNETLSKNITPTPSTGLIGLRDSLTMIPGGTFQGSGRALYLLRLPGVHLTGLWGEKSQGRNVGWGEWQAQDVGAFIKQVLTLCSFSGVESSRVVGKFGLAYALARMSLDGYGCRVQNLSAVRNPARGETLFSEHLYEVLLAISPGTEPAFLEIFADESSRFGKSELHKIGSTGGRNLEIEGLGSVALEELRQDYRKGWEANFESLA